MGKGTVTSDEHVDVKLTNGTLTSDRLRITGSGEVVRFEGNVVMHLDQSRSAPQRVAAPRAGDRLQPSRRPPRRGRTQQVRQLEMIFMMRLFRAARTGRPDRRRDLRRPSRWR